MKKIDPVQLVGVLANIGVLGGLIFLGYEMRQNTTQIRSQASYSVTEALSNLNVAISTTPVLADLVRRGEQDLFSLDPTELSQFTAYQFDRINLAAHIMVLEEDGVSEIQFPYVEFLVQEFHTKPGLQQWLASVEDTWVGLPDLKEMLGSN